MMEKFNYTIEYNHHDNLNDDSEKCKDELKKALDWGLLEVCFFFENEYAFVFWRWYKI